MVKPHTHRRTDTHTYKKIHTHTRAQWQSLTNNASTKFFLFSNTLFLLLSAEALRRLLKDDDTTQGETGADKRKKRWQKSTQHKYTQTVQKKEMNN